ncbi:uncharacterized protein BDZ83DRAFT_644291 [Colletotrichum acutatum]|uniref:Secreted protein n=1 Tax=Glomerella acutata TaxID=27357 RepID=A0AAD8U7N3_GLOAC|nr:uncharacterized protein BDZ83DRAFT_644291 [Colletotrichum acutatum]KAK1705169.1 hypothetical protein BDZ83DRAFT_644291 [Colletotrichum acutatum]
MSPSIMTWRLCVLWQTTPTGLWAHLGDRIVPESECLIQAMAESGSLQSTCLISRDSSLVHITLPRWAGRWRQSSCARAEVRTFCGKIMVPRGLLVSEKHGHWCRGNKGRATKKSESQVA